MASWRGVAAAISQQPHRGDVSVFDVAGQRVHLELEYIGGGRYRWGIDRQADPLLQTSATLEDTVTLVERGADHITLEIDGRRQRLWLAASASCCFVQGVDGCEHQVVEGTLLPEPVVDELAVGSVTAPSAAVVAEIHVETGDLVELDQPLVTLEAMKMLTVLRAPVAGRVEAVACSQGDSVASGQVLIALDAEAA